MIRLPSTQRFRSRARAYDMPDTTTTSPRVIKTPPPSPQALMIKELLELRDRVARLERGRS